ncbi:amidohydrolase family protein [uncultured Pontibacter sp.]|uniref:amidohydrolase family protein n=1 Tax=uncultured Pontibacter sp. TaxID=453356 RepID=UPI00261930AD|nr:amidohydrolase family protein [uncultured Pontibacter sp.]
MFDGSTVREQVDVLISDGVIISIGEHRAGEAAIVVDGKGKTIIPLLVNAHAHVYEPQHLKESLAQGIGTVLDLYTSSEKTKQLRVFNDSIPYATYYTSGPGATAPGGHGTQLGYPVPTVSHAGEANRFVRDRAAESVDYIKIIREPLRSTLDFETIRALIKASHQHKKLAIAHVSTLADALAISDLRINGFAHIWFDSAMDEEQLAQLTAQKPFVIPTLFATKKLLQYADQQDLNLHHLPFEKIQTEVHRLHQSQILLLAGTDAPNLGINYHDALLEELRLLKACGLSDLEVLKTATINPAIAFKFLENQLIKENSKANFLLVEGDPTSDIESLSNVWGIWKSGMRIK